MYERSYPLMGDKITFTIYGIEEVIAELLCADAYDYALKLENIFNLFDMTSEINTLNAKRDIKVSQHLNKVIKKALVYCEKTKGRYDISKGKAFLARKNKQSLPRLSCTYKDIYVKKDRVALTHPDVVIDLSSIAKGYIVDELTAFFQSHGVEEIFIDARGDMRIAGGEEVVDIQHPRKKGAITTITLRNEAIATSGDYLQYDLDYEHSHVLGNELISVSVIADDLCTADVLATCLMLLKPQEAQDFARREGVRAILLTKDLQEVRA
ncbi:FAD:protein FMN transferase [Candidatus Woesearchaeota archaeon]|nr:MAG: FAD:protein FMN transferase [Candidatus Woesearchaeota archaeon]